MHGRRSHARCTIPAAPAGILSISRDVLVRVADADPITVISREAGVPGERGHLTFSRQNAGAVPVRVSASRATMIAGSLRYLLLLNIVLEQMPDAP